MLLLDYLNATDVRKNWSQFNDDVVRKGPQFIKRNRDKWAALSLDQLKEAFSDSLFNASHLLKRMDLLPFPLKC